jgi:ketosteroid isomerase-like protein
MLNRAWVEKFTQEWAASWNARDLDSILAHYAPDVIFRSPRISEVLGCSQSCVRGLADLRDYWHRALASAKDLHFEIRDVLVGGDAITILYRNHRNQDVAETLVFDDDRKVIEGIVAYK